MSVEEAYKKKIFLGPTAFGHNSKLHDYRTRLEAAKIAPSQSCFASEDYCGFFKGGDSIKNNYKYHNKKRQMGGINPIHNHEPSGNVSAWEGNDTTKYSTRHFAIETEETNQDNSGNIKYCSVRVSKHLEKCLKLDLDKNKIGSNRL